MVRSYPYSNFACSSDVFFKAAEVDVEVVERREKRAEGCALGHLREGVDVLRETLAAVAELAVRPRHVGVHVVDVAREKPNSNNVSDALQSALPELGQWCKQPHLSVRKPCSLPKT